MPRFSEVNNVDNSQLRGKWLGEWDFSDKMEKLLGRMMSPNADLRCTAKQALADGYWKSQCDVEPPRMFDALTHEHQFC